MTSNSNSCGIFHIALLFHLGLITISPLPSVAASNFWNADNLVTTAADLLEQSDHLLREKIDPLLREIEESAHHQSHTNPNDKETFLIPLLSDYVGFNNQLMEYMTAAVVARATDRTLCLSPFFIGPLKHAEIKPQSHNNLAIEDHYNVEHLSKFVRVTSLENCRRVCKKKLNILLFLRGVRQPTTQKWDKKTISKDLNWSFVNWTSPTDIARDLSFLITKRCMGLGGLFPGLRWRGAYLAATEYIHPTSWILDAANALQEKAIGKNRTFLAVHWRFEESNCHGHRLGLCFLRCGDGSIIDSGFHPAAREWMLKTKHRCPSGFRGVAVTTEDIISAIYDRAKKDNLRMVYLATDGWVRGREAQVLLKQVVNRLRNSGLAVIGLWKVKGLPNFSDGSYFKFSELHTESSNALSLIEQELCFRATTFLGSGQSTWSLTVFRDRLAKRRSEQIRKEWKESKREEGINDMDEAVINSLLADEHAAGMQCRYQFYFNRVKVNATMETLEEEAPDGWLDLEACEKRIGRGGRCEVAACF